MNGQNKQTPEAFISSFGHPRKAELATALLSGDATIESLAEAGFGRIPSLEMIRNIRQNVIDMQEFDLDWPRDAEVEVPPVPVRSTPAPEVTPEAEVVPEVTPEVTPTPAPEAVGEVITPTPEAEVPTAETTPAPEVTPAPQG